MLAATAQHTIVKTEMRTFVNNSINHHVCKGATLLHTCSQDSSVRGNK